MRSGARAAEKLAEYDPVAVIAGHKKPDRPDNPAILSETAAYLRDFNRLFTGSTPESCMPGCSELYRVAPTPAAGAAPGQVPIARRMTGARLA